LRLRRAGQPRGRPHPTRSAPRLAAPRARHASSVLGPRQETQRHRGELACRESDPAARPPHDLPYRAGVPNGPLVRLREQRESSLERRPNPPQMPRSRSGDDSMKIRGPGARSRPTPIRVQTGPLGNDKARSEFRSGRNRRGWYRIPDAGRIVTCDAPGSICIRLETHGPHGSEQIRVQREAFSRSHGLPPSDR
jgi:hypothetical protein